MKVVPGCFVAVFLANSVLAGETLLAPVYPGALEVDEQQEQIAGNRVFGGFPEQRAMFLIKDGPEEVLAYYSKQGLAMGEPTSSHLGGLLADSHSREILDSKAVSDRLEDFTLVRSAGMEVFKPQARDRGVYLDLSRNSVINGHHSQAELEQLAERYAYLESCVFEVMKNDNGQWLPADKVLVDKYYAARKDAFSEPAMDMEQLARKMQELVLAGRMQEAQALTEKMTSGLGALDDTAAADTWQDGLDLLQELNLHAYRTVILIDKKPEQW